MLCPYGILSVVVVAHELKKYWDKAFAQVSSRKNQLDDMLLECRQFDDMLSDLDRWISQMEDELKAKSSTPNSPEDTQRQLRDYKVSPGV